MLCVCVYVGVCVCVCVNVCVCLPLLSLTPPCPLTAPSCHERWWCQACWLSPVFLPAKSTVGPVGCCSPLPPRSSAHPPARAVDTHPPFDQALCGALWAVQGREGGTRALSPRGGGQVGTVGAAGLQAVAVAGVVRVPLSPFRQAPSFALPSDGAL